MEKVEKGIVMKVSSVQKYSYTPSNKGSFVKDYAFKELSKKLNGPEKDSFETIIKDIENTTDDHRWWFDTSSLHHGKMKIARIGIIGKDGNPKKPGYFLDREENTLKLFKKLAQWYENNVEGFKK